MLFRGNRGNDFIKIVTTSVFFKNKYLINNALLNLREINIRKKWMIEMAYKRSTPDRKLS